jgi:hypothetical protein
MSAIKTSPAIGYLRVSNQEQGRSGLGLAAQRSEIEAFGVQQRLAVNSWYPTCRGICTSCKRIFRTVPL